MTVGYYVRLSDVELINESNGWTTPEIVSIESNDNSYPPCLAVGPHGTLHVAWADKMDYDGAGEDNDIFYKTYFFLFLFLGYI